MSVKVLEACTGRNSSITFAHELNMIMNSILCSYYRTSRDFIVWFYRSKEKKNYNKTKDVKKIGRVKLAGVCGGPCNPSYWEAGVWDASLKC